LLITAVPTTLGAIWLGDGVWFMPSWSSMLVIAYIALVPMCIGNVAWFSIVGLLPAQVAGLSSIMVPVVAMLSGALVHGEPLGAVQWLAMVCSVAGLWLALGRPRGA
jgi:drug/metabolite transporter (DMT)-like permease